MTDAQALNALNQHLSSAVAISTWLENRPGAGPEGAPYDKLGSELRGALSQLSHLSTGPGSRPGDLNVTCERRETRREPVIVLPPIRPLENASALQGHVQMRPSTAGVGLPSAGSVHSPLPFPPVCLTSQVRPDQDQLGECEPRTPIVPSQAGFDNRRHCYWLTNQSRSTTSQPHVSGDAYEQLRCNSTHVLFSPLGPLPSRRSSFPPSGAAGAFSGSLRGVESPKFGAIGPNRRPGPPGEYVWRTELDEYNSSVGAVTIPQNRLWSRFGLEDGTSGSRGRRASSSILTNAAGLRICRECKQTGRYKDGKCIEKWGPGPAGPGTVCDRCRKRMKRSQQRIAEAEATLAMMSHTSFGHSQPNFHTLQHPEQPSAPPAMLEMSGRLPCPDVTGNGLPRASMPSASTSTGSIMRIQSLLGDSVGSAPSRPRSGMSHRPGSSSSLSRSHSSDSSGETEADGPSQSHNSISYEDDLYSQAASRSMTP